MKYTRLMKAILEDPGAQFDLEADLPSGNRMKGTIGPVVGDKLTTSLTFSICPASEEDVTIAINLVNQALGQKAAVALVSNSPEERQAALQKMRGFMGGGKG